MNPSLFSEVKNLSFKPVFVLLISSLCLVCIHFLPTVQRLASYSDFFSWFGASDFHTRILVTLTEGDHSLFWRLVYWVCHTLIFYFVIPCLAVKYILKEKLSDYGLKWKGMFSAGKVYFAALLFILPFVVWVSYSPHFQVTYPFFVPTNKSDMIPYFLCWELMYVLQFFALEFFFRGFMVQGLKPQFGAYSVFVMVIPYCMIHFGKPMPEGVGSIFAGVFLGLMSYRTGSVWLGAMLHVAVALSMDFLSLWHKGYF